MTLEPLLLSLLNDYLFCRRRAGLKMIEGLRGENVHTLIGDLAHEHADLPGYESQISNLKSQIILLRALPVFSRRLGLSGKCDIVEQHPGGELVPVEYKKSKRRKFENDDAQLCAQALCLEEMFSTRVERGAVFHAASKHRREVVFTAELRDGTEKAIAALRALEESGAVPAAIFKPQCEECSLFPMCLPQITSLPPQVTRAAEQLWSVKQFEI